MWKLFLTEKSVIISKVETLTKEVVASSKSPGLLDKLSPSASPYLSHGGHTCDIQLIFIGPEPVNCLTLSTSYLLLYG